MSSNKRTAHTTLANLRKDLSRDAPAIVRVIRHLKGWTQQRLAKELHTYPATVARWEAGTHVPRGGYLAALHLLQKDLVKQNLLEESGWKNPRPRKKKKYKLPKALTPSEAVEVDERYLKAQIREVLADADQMIGLYRDTVAAKGSRAKK